MFKSSCEKNIVAAGAVIMLPANDDQQGGSPEPLTLHGVATEGAEVHTHTQLRD